VLKVRGLNKTYNKLKALDALDMNIERGSIYGLVGQNGAGKTTLMRIVSGVLSFDSGDIEIYNMDMKKQYSGIKEKIAFIPDSFAYHYNITVEEYMEFFASCYGFEGLRARQRYTKLLQMLSLDDKMQSLVGSLSRGMQQRLSLARALINDPDFIIMDEPTSGLDPKTNYSFKELIRQLNSEDRTILISSHMLSELSEVCTDIGVIDHGHMVIESSLSDILNKFNNTNPIKIRIMGNEDKAFKIFKEDVNVRHVSAREGIFFIKFTGTKRDEAALLKKLVAEDIPVSEFMREEAKLETFFMDITASNKERIIIENDY
jgi:ABC transporter, ATP-binding protein